MTHANTPAIEVIDARRLGVREVAYHRRDGAQAPESCITQQIHSVAGRAVLSRDPRLFLLHLEGRSAANQLNVVSLSGAVLLSENGDAGWRLGLLGEDGQGVEGWDQKLSQSQVRYDGQRRPIAAFESAHGGPQRCIARYAYADNSADESHNRRGQLIRQDDTAGSLRFIEFGLAGTPLVHSRTFVDDPLWSVDWPETEDECDAFLEDETAVTRIHCNAAGEPVRQTDAKGNVQASSQNCAGELKEIRLTLTGQTKENTLVSDIQYNAFGLVEHQRAGNGVISCATFRHEDGRLDRLKAYVEGQSALQQVTYEYDAVGNIVCLTDAANLIHYHRNQRIEPTDRYRYDSLYRLIEASGRQLRNAPGGPQLPAFQPVPDPGQLENYTRLYSYDKAGNLEVMQHQADSGNRTERTAIARSNNRNLPQKANGELPDENEIAAGYDVNGNRTSLQPGQGLRWDPGNRLRQVDQVVREDEPDDIEFYLYDGSGQRLRKIRQAYTGTLTRTHETRYLPGLEIRTSPDEILHVITVKAGRGTVQVLHWEKRPASDIPQHQHRYNFTDHLNSSTVEVDGAARLIAWESYYPFGGTCWWAGRNKLEASYKTIRYSGQQRDATGLYYYGYRYYVPWCQRWLNADPSGVVDGLNLFAMVHGNPVGHVDLQGLITSNQVTGAAAASFGRDFSASLVGGFVRWGTAMGIAELASSETEGSVGRSVDPGVNLAMTVLGTGVGAMAWGSMGMGAGSQMASRYTNNRTTQRVAAGLGGLVGAVFGGAIPLYAYWSDPGELNTTAIAFITSASGNLTREAAQRTNAELGPRVTLPPSALSAFFRALVYGSALFGTGAARAETSAVVGLFISATVEGIDAASTITINAFLGGTYTRGTNRLQVPRLWELMYGLFTRTAATSVTASLTYLSSPLTDSITNPNLTMGLQSTLSAYTTVRTLLGQHVQRGTAELFQIGDGDFTLDNFTPAIGESYHPDLPNGHDIPMTIRHRGSSS